ncbi:MAG: polysaccharide biosynthesis C-terminal domain-containing protein [Clostridium sp.]|nr:polysaccharide biosynthesis C-terminal domain-containing protein [Clostridium sp.]MCM1476097.1 polysaccharide biosynthesis C-terminal domain-containing protein [Muribaculaceae bacterium]
MAGIKSLVKDTAVYGLSSIIGRFLNWCLVPLYVYIFKDPASYGVVSYLYSFTAVALVILNYGMETGFFRFANKDPEPEKVYTTSLLSVGFTSLLFILLLSAFINPVSRWILLPNDSLYIWLLGITVAVDAFCNIPFAYLRYKNKAFLFAGIRLFNVFLNIALNLFFLVACPAIEQSYPALISWFYAPVGGADFGIGWIFVANIISTLGVFIALLPQLPRARWRFDGRLLRKMLSYSWPLLILGVAGILSQNMGQLIIPRLFEGNEEAARTMVGIYGANIKIAIVMVMFTQAFRYAYEPFIFSNARKEGENNRQAYADAMKFFLIFALWIFLGVMFYLPILKFFISPGYWEGLRVVPIMMIADICFGIFFNLSLWYKLTDRTQWGMYFSLICFALMLGLNVWFVPLIGIPDGYMGSAWAALISYFLVMVLSYFVGRHYYPIDYPLKRMGTYTLLAGVLYAIGVWAEWPQAIWATYTLRTLMLILYIAMVCSFEQVPLITPLFKRLGRGIYPPRGKR